MITGYLIIGTSSLLIILLTIRQIRYFNQEKNINLSFLVFGIGFLFTTVHILTLPKGNLLIFFRDLDLALLPLIIGLFFSIFLTFMHQAQLRIQQNRQDINDVSVDQKLQTISDNLNMVLEDINIINLEKKQYSELKIKKSTKKEDIENSTLSDDQEKLVLRFEEVFQLQLQMYEVFKNLVEKEVFNIRGTIEENFNQLRDDNSKHFHLVLEDFDKSKSVFDKALKEQSALLQGEVAILNQLFQNSADFVVTKTETFFETWYGSFENKFNKLFYHLSEIENEEKNLNKLFSLINEKASIGTERIEAYERRIQSLMQESLEINPIFTNINETFVRVKVILDEYKEAKIDLRETIKALKLQEKDHFVNLEQLVFDSIHTSLTKLTDTTTQRRKEDGVDLNQTLKELKIKAEANQGYGMNKNE